MYNLISYSLFGKKSSKSKIPEIYQIAVPYIIIANNIAYPTFNQRFYISHDLRNSAAAQLVQKLSQINDTIQCNIISGDYNGVEPMLWRILPWWDKDVNYVFCRDIDSSITKIEIKAVRLFLQSKLKIHSIRSYHLHTTPLMGGLCAFNCPWMRQQSWFPKNFKYFLTKSASQLRSYKPWVEGADQEALRYFIYDANTKRFTNMKHTLDSFVQTAPSKIAHYNPIVYNKQQYDQVDISDLIKYEKMFTISDSIHSFVASPFKRIQKKHIYQLLNIADTKLSKQVKQILEEPIIKEFYCLND